ncbi:MAG: hypothetical protein JNM99_06890 [Verrucomicrobiaceae bacterium]|nr:hypothetical protein [Verrucomicrobiaceae bacterium]
MHVESVEADPLGDEFLANRATDQVIALDIEQLRGHLMRCDHTQSGGHRTATSKDAGTSLDDALAMGEVIHHIEVVPGGSADADDRLHEWKKARG